MAATLFDRQAEVGDTNPAVAEDVVFAVQLGLLVPSKPNEEVYPLTLKTKYTMFSEQTDD